MKKLIIYLFIFLISGSVLFSQTPNWITYNESNSDLPVNNIKCIFVAENGVKWIGTYGGGLVKINGSNWTIYNKDNSGLPGNIVYDVIVDKNDDVWIATSYGLVYFDGNEWVTYNKDNSGLFVDRVNALAIDSDGIVWIGTSGGLTTFDGTNWYTYFESNSDLPDEDITALSIDNNGWKCIGTKNGGLAFFDGYSQWSIHNNLNTDLSSNYIKSIAVDSDNNIWTGLYGAFDGGNLAKYNGSYWTIYKILGMSTWCIAIDENGNVWYGTEAGLVMLNSWGTAYTTYISELPDVNVQAVSVGIEGNIWIGTYSGGLAIYNENGVVSVEDELNKLPENYSLKQNYPNPFNPSTTINYAISQSGFVTIKIYDIMGQEVSTLVNEEKQPGNYEIQFNATNLSSGIYLYQMRMNDFNEIKKFVLTK